MSQHLDTARGHHEAIRNVLLHEWDPIGVSNILGAEDEYDGYVGQIYGMLIRREPRKKLIEHLWWIETEHMRLSGNHQHTEHIADRLLEIAEFLDDGVPN